MNKSLIQYAEENNIDFIVRNSSLPTNRIYEIFDIIKDVDLDVLYKNLFSLMNHCGILHHGSPVELVDVKLFSNVCKSESKNKINYKDYFSVILKEKETSLNTRRQWFFFKEYYPNALSLFIYPSELIYEYSIVAYFMNFKSYEELMIKMDLMGIDRYDII